MSDQELASTDPRVRVRLVQLGRLGSLREVLPPAPGWEEAWLLASGVYLGEARRNTDAAHNASVLAFHAMDACAHAGVLPVPEPAKVERILRDLLTAETRDEGLTPRPTRGLSASPGVLAGLLLSPRLCAPRPGRPGYPLAFAADTVPAARPRRRLLLLPRARALSAPTLAFLELDADHGSGVWHSLLAPPLPHGDLLQVRVGRVIRYVHLDPPQVESSPPEVLEVYRVLREEGTLWREALELARLATVSVEEHAP